MSINGRKETCQYGPIKFGSGFLYPHLEPAFRTSDVEYVTINVQHEGFWPGFCHALKLQDWQEGRLIHDGHTPDLTVTPRVQG